MWQDYVGLVSGCIAVGQTVIGAALVHFRPETRRSKMLVVILFLIMGVSAISTIIWSEHITLTQKMTDKLNRQHLRAGLSQAIQIGQAILEDTSKPDKPINNEQAQTWADNTENYLTIMMGKSYVIRFRSTSGIAPLFLNFGTEERQKLWSAINRRLTRLEQFSEEIPADPN